MPDFAHVVLLARATYIPDDAFLQRAERERAKEHSPELLAALPCDKVRSLQAPYPEKLVGLLASQSAIRCLATVRSSTRRRQYGDIWPVDDTQKLRELLESLSSYYVEHV